MALRNPFTPTFGIVPSHLAGRKAILGEMAAAFENGLGDPNLSTVIIGPRGCGKTALLSCIADEARPRGWVAVTVVAAPGMLDDILQRSMEAAAEFVAPRKGRHLTGLSVAQLLGLEWTLDPSGEANWRTRMNALFSELAKHDVGLLVNVDEVNVSVDEMAQLASTYQLLIGEGRKMALVMAGLPKNVTDLVEDDRISFLRRSRQRELGPIAAHEVENAYRLTIEEGGKTIQDEALALMVDAAGGFAYMMQLVGYCVWSASGVSQTITSEHARAGIERAADEFERGVLATTYREMSPGDRAFALAMLKSTQPTTITSVAAAMGKGTNYASTYKSRLLKQGVIVEREGKTFDFAMPGMRAYLAKKAE